MSEIALVTARKARLQRLVDEGDSAAIAAIKLGEDPTRFLSTIQIGITSIGVLKGTVGEAALLSGSTKGLLRLMGVRETSGYSVTEAEIHAVLAEGTSAGVIESHEHTMVRNVFLLDDRQLSSLMVPRGDVVVLDIHQPFEDKLKLIDSADHARFPVVNASLDDILGIINARQLLSQVAQGETPDLRLKLQAPLYVPETLTGMELLDNFRSSDVHMAFVIDECHHR